MTRMTRPSATVRRIADEAGVSPASVSRALRNPDGVRGRTRELVQAAIERLEGEVLREPDAALPLVGCVFANATSGPKFSGFDATIWAGVSRAAMSLGAEVLIINLERRGLGESLGEIAQRSNIGALAIRLDNESTDLLDEIDTLGIPSITISHKHDHPAIGYICVRSRETSRSAVKHLIHLGHRRIALCHNFVLDHDHIERRAGYREALAEHGIAHDPELEIAIPADADGGVSAVDRLMALPDRPTAAYFVNPFPTIGALRRLHELGVSVPRDFSVIGFDDNNERELGCPMYTAVCQDAPKIAETAGRWLCRAMLSGKATPVARIELDSFLEINDTTARAPGTA